MIYQHVNAQTKIRRCPLLIIAQAASFDGNVDTECLREKCAMWDADVAWQSGLSPRCGIISGARDTL